MWAAATGVIGPRIRSSTSTKSSSKASTLKLSQFVRALVFIVKHELTAA